MWWHKEDRKEDHMIRHPVDGSRWRNLNREYPQFDNDPRNIRFALSTDGMNPYGEFGSAHCDPMYVQPSSLVVPEA